jgi:hypothetical protein
MNIFPHLKRKNMTDPPDPPITDTIKLLFEHEKRLSRIEGKLQVLLMLMGINITLLLALIMHIFVL